MDESALPIAAALFESRRMFLSVLAASGLAALAKPLPADGTRPIEPAPYVPEDTYPFFESDDPL